ncbi:LysR substrate-binding domain-containing protein [Pollutimonas sp. M17]|uniref:LysR substrate-binding domain-containing protein n=1 Tax=Pollutimonas sp. M17 TaxID=2962065 RepID=UPI0021F3F268|nr:LysR substrate-binding domain-containing protein [Pollutimonas sp. M17]UYO93217.1 LysR substrate-binding domain-containing protein [Pollutimonas sp. M17]
MELRHLRYFIALAGSLNFTRAAERVHVTQSTLSHQIRQLEEELGQRLFDRKGKRVVLTEAGESFLAYATRALAVIDQGLSELKQTVIPMTGTVRIGTTHTFNLGFLPDCIALFLKHNPTVKVVIEELSGDAITEGLKEEQLDVGIAYRPEQQKEIRFEPLFNEELALVVGHTHPLAKRKRLRIAELHRESLVLLPPSFSTRRLLDECFSAAGAEPNVIAEMNTIPAMLGLLARENVGTIAAPSAVAEHSKPWRIIPLEGPTPIRTHGLLFMDKHAQTPASMAFITLIRKQAMAGKRGATPA